jgi:endonuclease/exonuclease/phosphatase family metal-dependent hydrolase
MGAMQIAQYISVHSEKFILTGDFNATPETPEIKVISDALAYRGSVDCSEKLGPTYHGFGDLPAERWVKIDYIFSDAPCKECYLVEDIPVEGKYYSDHNAVCAILEME